MISKFRFGIVALLAGFLMAAPAQSQDDAEKPEMTKADSINMSKRHLSFGQRYYNSGQYEDAETQLLKSWGYNPSRSTTARYLGRLYNKLENYDEAVGWYQKAIELAPKSKYTKSAHQDLVGIFVIQENYESAIEQYEALLGFATTQEDEIKYLHGIVSLCIEIPDYEKALSYAKRWSELAPDDPVVVDMVAKLQLQTGDEDAALEEMEKVLEMNPDDQVTRDRLASMYKSRGDLDKAFAAYEKLHAHDLKNAMYLENLVTLSAQLGKSDSYRVRILRKLLKLQPQNIGVIEQLADKTGDFNLINRGLKLDARNGKLLYLKGDYYYKKWQKSNAQQDSINSLNWFKKALKDPQWQANAQRMIYELNPPLSDEEKMRRKFFEQSKQKKEEVKQEGKK